MARVNIVLPDDLEQRFRAAVFKYYGLKKGNISEAVKDALETWIEWRESLEAKQMKK